VRGEQSAALLDQRMGCLDRRLADLGALAERLAAADAGLVDRALAAIAGLPDPDRCTGEARVERPPPSPETAELFALASKVRAAELAGDRPEAAALARRGLARARELGDAHALAELGFLSGRLRAELGDIDEAERELVEAARAAREIGDESAVAGIWTELVHVVGIEKLAYDRAMVWAHAAEREIQRLPPIPVLESRLLSTIASVYTVNGKAEEAERYHALALEAARPLEASDPLLYGHRLYNAGVFYRSQNRLDRAESLLSEALERFERELHPRHPTTAGARRELAKVAVARGDPARAVDMFRGAIADLEAALGRDAPEVVASRMPLAAALARINKLDEAGRLAAEVVDSSADVHDRGAAHSILGRVARQRGDFDEALEHHRQAVALLQEGYGKADHPVVRSERIYVGIALTKLERHDEAIAILEELLKGADEANRAPLHHNLAEALIDAGRCDRARPHLEAVIEIVEKQGGADHPNLAFPLVALAECARAVGRPAEAVDRLERALELRRGTGDVGVAEVLFELARSRWQSGDRAAAKRDAGEAIELLSGAEGTAPMIAEVRAWLAKRR
jgi:tetratricopeptide (TPR) repeat protein